MNKVEDFFKLLPQHYQKEGTKKYFNTLKSVFEYLDDLISESIGMQNIQKAHERYLDYIGYRMQVERNGLNDEEYRKILEMQRFKFLNKPTTESLIEMVKKMTGYIPVNIVFRPAGEPASQYFRYKLDAVSDINLFPDLNGICEAGARMYWDLQIADIRLDYNFASIVDIGKKIEVGSNFEIDQTVNIKQQFNYGIIAAITKKIEVGGTE